MSNNPDKDAKDTVVTRHKENFSTLQRAFNDGNVALLECYDKRLEENVAVICAVTYDPYKEEYTFIPFASMANENSYDRFVPPLEDKIIAEVK